MNTYEDFTQKDLDDLFDFKYVEDKSLRLDKKNISLLINSFINNINTEKSNFLYIKNITVDNCFKRLFLEIEDEYKSIENKGKKSEFILYKSADQYFQKLSRFIRWNDLVIINANFLQINKSGYNNDFIFKFHINIDLLDIKTIKRSLFGVLFTITDMKDGSIAPKLSINIHNFDVLEEESTRFDDLINKKKYDELKEALTNDFDGGPDVD